jgi:hypothetical protein
VLLERSHSSNETETLESKAAGNTNGHSDDAEKTAHENCSLQRLSVLIKGQAM